MSAKLQQTHADRSPPASPRSVAATSGVAATPRAHTRRAAAWAIRIAAVAAIGWASVAPAYRVPSAASAAGMSGGQVAGEQSRQSVGEYAVAGGAIGNYFGARGGQRTFGAPLSSPFMLLGADIQIFRNHALKHNPDGSVSTLPLLGMGAVPGLRIGGRTLPAIDQALIDSSPDPSASGYAARAQAFIREHAPNEWQGVPVGFERAFLATVTFQDAFPSGSGDRNLLPGMAREIWGLPVSRPMRDPGMADIVYLRWERGVMAFDARTGGVEAVPLGETFRAVLTGEGIPGDLIADAQSSPFYAQFQPTAANGLARPEALADTSLAGAFQVNRASSFTSAAAAGGQAYETATPYGPPTSTPYGGYYGQPTATPYGYAATPVPGNPYPPQPGQPGYPNTTYPPQPGQPGYDPNQPNQGSSIGGSGVSGSGAPQVGVPGQVGAVGSPGAVDACVGDEQITFAPEQPRVGNEFLIAVSSSRPHPYGRLAGTEATVFQRERQGQLGLVWEWVVRPSYPGRHKYTFYVDSTIPCKTIELEVEQQLATRTPRPTRTPTPYGFNSNRNGNGNSNSNSNDNNTSGTSGTADISVVLTGPQQIGAGQQARYSARVDNFGPESVDNISLTAQLSTSGVELVAISTSAGNCSTSSTLQGACTLARIDRGTGVTIELTARVLQSSAPSSFSLTANISSNRTDSNFSNNYATANTNVSAGFNSIVEPTSTPLGGFYGPVTSTPFAYVTPTPFGQPTSTPFAQPTSTPTLIAITGPTVTPTVVGIPSGGTLETVTLTQVDAWAGGPQARVRLRNQAIYSLNLASGCETIRTYLDNTVQVNSRSASVFAGAIGFDQSFLILQDGKSCRIVDSGPIS